jgi:hypothetical protein
MNEIEKSGGEVLDIMLLVLEEFLLVWILLKEFLFLSLLGDDENIFHSKQIIKLLLAAQWKIIKCIGYRNLSMLFHSFY